VRRAGWSLVVAMRFSLLRVSCHVVPLVAQDGRRWGALWARPIVGKGPQPVTNGREDCVWTRARARQWSGACGQGTSYMDGVLGPAGLPVRCAGCGRDAREACPGRTGEGCAGVEATGDGLPMGGVSPWEVPANGGTGRRNTMMRRRDDDAEEMGWRGLPMDGGVACLMRAAAVPLAAWARGSMVAR